MMSEDKFKWTSTISSELIEIWGELYDKLTSAGSNKMK